MLIDIHTLPREELLKLLDVYAKNWLAHDGCWFLAIEEKYGIDIAIEMDTRAWERFAGIEAKRIVKTFDIPENGGLKALESAFSYRLYAMINKQEAEWKDDNTLIFMMKECRVQVARRRKNLPDFPCKPVGTVEFTQFAKAVDPRIAARCITCPPDPVTDKFCAWEFTLK
ncbi:MAG: hypothetical protein GY863_07695 [bacterium]|nr:hypothetical protein [bacterium]